MVDAKLYIINNGLKDLRGHYFETSVAVAEASQSLGLHAILAAHVTCPCDIVPEGLDFHGAFTTDHWMAHPPSAQPDLHGLRGELTRLAAHSIEDLMAGKIRFDEYLEARSCRKTSRSLRVRLASCPYGGWFLPPGASSSGESPGRFCRLPYRGWSLAPRE